MLQIYKWLLSYAFGVHSRFEVLCLGDVAEAWSLFLGASSSTVSVWWTVARSFGPHHTDGRQDGEGLNRMDALMEEIRLSLS